MAAAAAAAVPSFPLEHRALSRGPAVKHSDESSRASTHLSCHRLGSGSRPTRCPLTALEGNGFALHPRAQLLQIGRLKDACEDTATRFISESGISVLNDFLYTRYIVKYASIHSLSCLCRPGSHGDSGACYSSFRVKSISRSVILNWEYSIMHPSVLYNLRSIILLVLKIEFSVRLWDIA